MAPGRSAPAEKDVYSFIIEADKKKGCRPDYVDIITKLLTDKIFACREDVVGIHKLGFRNTCDYRAVSWDVLKEFCNNARQSAENRVNSSAVFTQEVLDTIEGMSAGAVIDTFEARKLLIFGNFDNFLLNKRDLETLKKKVIAEDMMLTFVFPDAEEMSEQQSENYKIVKEVLANEEGIYVFTLKESLRRILNIVSQREKRSMPWNQVFQIGTGLGIPIRKLILNRKQSPWTLLHDKTVARSGGASKGTKETKWLDSEGNEVDESDIVDAYAYGEQLVTIEGTPYQSGEGCLKLLVFAPKENIHPAYFVGDGSDIVFPDERHPDGVKKFDALLKAMHKMNRVAVCRKVYRKGTRVTLCALSPDPERGGLILTELCFADDVSIPSFPPLMKEAQEKAVSEKDQLIDDLIDQKSIPDFTPQKGPVDPSVIMFREYITHKIIDGEDTKPKLRDNISLNFDCNSVDEKLIEKLKATFHLTVKKETGGDRPSGRQVFRKRKTDGEDSPLKKPKVDEAAVPVEENEPEVEEAAVDIDELLDDL